MNEQWILNYVNFRAYILLPFDWFKNNQLLSQLTHARYRDTVPLSRKIFLPTLVYLPLHHVTSTWTFPSNQYMSHILKLS